MNFLKTVFFIAVISTLSACSGDGGPFNSWETKQFPKTALTENSELTVTLANTSETDEQHITSLGFNDASNKNGHFQLVKIMIGNKNVGTNDIVIPPNSELKIFINYAPLDLVTSVADYGGWETGQKPRWIPSKPEDYKKKKRKKEKEATHRCVFEIIYDYPKDGLVLIQLVGTATKGPNGETSISTGPGECIPGNGIACYTGGFSIDIPALYSTGPKDLELTGAIKFTINSGVVTLDMNDFPPILMYLRSEEIPQLPAGVTATLIISGSPDETAEGSFDGSRMDVSKVALRVRVALGEIKPEDITPGMASMVDFTIQDLDIKTISPLENGKIIMHIETTLAQSPSGNPLFDDFLSGAQIIVTMDGQLAL